MILHIPLVEDIPIVEIVPIVGHRLVCEDEQMFSSVEDVELGEVEHVAGILLDDSEVIDGHLELLLGLCNLPPLQDGARHELGVHSVLDLHVFIQLLALPKDRSSHPPSLTWSSPEKKSKL